MSDLNDFLREKLRVPTGTTHDAPDGGDRELQDAAQVLADEASDVPYTPPMAVPISRPDELREETTRRGPQSEVWLINPPAALPALGNLVGGGTSEKGSQFSINSIRIDNLSGQWVYFPELGAWVPPNWYGRVLRYDGSKIQRVRFETPGGITGNTVDTAEIVRVVFSNDYWPEVDGENIAGAAPTLPSNVVIGGDAGQVQSQAGSADAQSGTPLGLLTNNRMYGWDLVNWDRVRTGAAGESATASLSNLGVLKGQMYGANGAGTLFPIATPGNVGDASSLSNALPVGAWGYIGSSLWNRSRIPNVFKQVASSAIGAGSTVTVWTPAAGLKPRLMGWVVTGSSGLVDAAVTFFETSTTGTFMGETGFLAGVQSPSFVNFGPGGPIVSTSSAVIVAFSSTGLTLRGTLFGTEE